MPSSRNGRNCAGSGQGKRPLPKTTRAELKPSSPGPDIEARVERAVVKALAPCSDYVPRGMGAGLQRHALRVIRACVNDEVARAKQATLEWQRKP